MTETHPAAARLTVRMVQLVVSCALLGLGVALLLDARLGSDGYSMLISGLSISTEVEFAVVNVVVGVLLVLMAWWRGLKPGLGTLVQPVVVGVVVSLTLAALPGPTSYAGRWTELVLGFVVLCVGVAGYLAVDLGAGPAEGAALAFDPPVPFKWSYSLVQLVGSTVGWLLGASFGPGTLLVILLIGPCVDRLLPLLGRRPAPSRH